MRIIKIIVLTTLVLMNTQMLFAQNHGPQITLKETEYQFGTLCKGAPATYDFIFTNTGDEPLEITNIRSSCGCLVVTCTTKTVEPNKYGVISVKYNSNNIGSFTKTTTITTNAINQPRIILRVKGEVISDREVFSENGKKGMRGCDGNIKLPCIYEAIIALSNGYVEVKKNGKWGIVMENNSSVIPVEYDALWTRNNGTIVVSKNNRWGIIDMKNKVLIPFEYDDTLFSIGENSYNAKKYGKWGIIDDRNRVMIPFMYDNKLVFSSRGYAITLKNGKWGMIDESNRTIISFEYDYIGEEEDGDGFLVVGKNGLYGVINYHNKVTIPIAFNRKPIFVGGIVVFAYSQNGKYGGMNKNGDVVIPFEYDHLDYFFHIIPDDANYYSFAKKNGKWGIIDVKNRVIIPFEYNNLGVHHELMLTLYLSSLRKYKGGVAIGEKNGKYVVIDRNNKVIATRESMIGDEE